MSVNLLEYAQNYQLGLSQIKRLLSPGAVAVLVIPSGPGSNGHCGRSRYQRRRNAREEIADEAHGVRLRMEIDMRIWGGWPIGRLGTRDRNHSSRLR